MTTEKDFQWNTETVHAFFQLWKREEQRLNCHFPLDYFPLILNKFKAELHPKEEKTKQRDWEIVEGCMSANPNSPAKIKSVKRLSDNEVFSIGDRVDSLNNSLIDAFFLDYKGNDLWVSIDAKNGYGFAFDVVKKAKPKILFTTADGVAIYEGDEVYSVGKLSYEIGFVGRKVVSIIHSAHHEHYYYFSTEVAAKEYVSYNKPCLSVNDVLNAFDGLKLQSDFYRNVLKELAKSKL